MKRFNSLKLVQHVDAHREGKEEIKKYSVYNFCNSCNITKYLEKSTSVINTQKIGLQDFNFCFYLTQKVEVQHSNAAHWNTI